MKILFKSKLLDEDTKFQIQHSTKNIIKIDPGSTESSDGGGPPSPVKVKQSDITPKSPTATPKNNAVNKLHPMKPQ